MFSSSLLLTVNGRNLRSAYAHFAPDLVTSPAPPSLSAITERLGIPGLLLRPVIVDVDGSELEANAHLMESLNAAWDKVANTSFFSSGDISKIRQLLSDGIIAQPAKPAFIQNVNPGISQVLIGPPTDTPARRVAYESVCDQFQNILGLYYKGQYSDAVNAGITLNDNAVFWDNVYAVDKFIADLPATVADKVATGALELGAKVALQPSVIIVGLLVVGVIAVYMTRGKIVTGAVA